MNSPCIPIFHLERLSAERTNGGADDPARFGAFHQLVDALDGEEAETPSFASLVRGRIAESGLQRPCLPTLGDVRRDRLDAWCRRLGPLGWSSIWATPLDSLDGGDSVDSNTLGMLAGQGVVVASRGVSGDPLVSMDVGRLRDELERSREQLSELCGYPIRWLVPPPTPTGHAADELVVDEARRAGYSRILVPGWHHAEPEDDAHSPLPMLVLDDVDSVDAVLRWLRRRPGSGLETRVRSWLRRPKRILEDKLGSDGND